MIDSGSMNASDWYRGKTAVVSGATGYIAAAVIERLSNAGAKVVKLSRELTGDYADTELWRRVLPGADAVFHLAAQTSFYKAAENPDADFAANVAPMRALLEAGRGAGLKPFIVFAGSSTEAGLPQRATVDETHPDAPVTVYDLHKLLAEKLLEGYARQGLARGATLRLSNVYGPGPKSSAADRGILNASIAKALRGEPLTVYGKGEPVRDYLYIDDLAGAFLAAGRGGPALDGRHFVMGSGRGVSLKASFELVAARVEVKTGRKVPVVSVPEPPGLSPIEARRFVADASAFRAAAGWAPKVALEDGIDRTIESLPPAGARP